MFRLPIILLLVLLSTHAPAQSTIATRRDNVGDIAFDPALDDTSFHLHDSAHVWQYYNSAYWLDHKDSITRFIRGRYQPPTNAATATNANGWLTIRFIINTEGRTGRFRLQEMDTAYQPTHFDPHITQTLVAAIKDWPFWRPAHYKDIRLDTYQYISFHLRKGQITTISP